MSVFFYNHHDLKINNRIKFSDARLEETGLTYDINYHEMKLFVFVLITDNDDVV